MTASDPSAREAGFTLMELLVSIALMGLVLAGLGAGLSTVAKGWDRHSGHLANQDMLLRAQSQLVRDMGSIERISWAASASARQIPGNTDALQSQTLRNEPNSSDESDDRPPRFIFKGEPDRIRFIAIEPPRPSRPGPYILSYGVSDGGKLVRSRVRFHPDIKDLEDLSFKDPVTLIAGSYRYRFSYGEQFSADDGISNAWRWFPSWPHEDKLPSLIKFEIRHARTGALVLAPIVVRPRIDVEPACAEKRKASAGCTVDLKPQENADNQEDKQEVGNAKE